MQVVTSDTFNRYKIIGSGTGIAPTFTTDGNDANVNMYVTAKGAGKIGINTTSPTGYVHAVSSSSSTVGLIVEGATGQTSTNIFEVQRAGGGDPSFTVSHNYIDLNRNTTAAASMTVYGANSGQTPLHIKGRASQTADLVSIQQSSGFALARFDANANIVLGNTSVDSNNYLSFIKAGGAVGGNAGIRFGNDADGTNQHTLTVNTSNADLTLEHKNVNSRFIVKGAASQTANLTEWQNSAGTVLTSISPTGKLTSAVDASINGMTIGLGGGNVPTNIALGNSALLSNTTGFGNSAIGLSALQSNTTGWGNVGIGTRALQNFSGSVNTAIGYESLRYATAEGLVAIGYGSLSLNTSGVQNTAVGYSALGANVTGGANTALGSQSSRISTGHRNTSVGFYSAYSLTTGTDNTFLGSQAGQSFTTGSSNIAIGSYNSWYDVSTGSGNTFVGVDGGGQPVTGSNNTTLGYQTTISSSSVSNEITLGNSSVTRFRIPGIGLNITSNSTINTASASTVGLIIKGAASQTADLQQWQDSAGNVLATLKSSGTLVIGGTVSVNSMFGITLYNKVLTSFYTGNNTSYEGTFNFTKGNTTGQWMAIGSTGNGANGVASINIADGGNFKLFSVGYTGNTEINLSSASSVGLIVKAAASQTADLQQWQDSAGTVLAKIMSNGSLFVNSTGTANDPITIQRASATRFKVDPYGNVFAVALTAGNVVNSIAGTTAGIYATSASTIGAVIRGAASQTANLQEWQDSAGIVLAKIDASGNITDASNTKWLSPIGSGSDDAPTIQALIDAGKKEIRLGSGQWTFSTRIKVPNGVTIRGTGTSRSSTTGTRVNAVALIASEGTVRDIMFTGAGENAQSELGGGGIAVLGGRVIDCSITDSRWVLAPTRQPHGYLKNFMSKMQGSYGSVKVAVLGDSLSENTSTTSWYGYLFNSATSATGYYLGSYFGHQIAPSEVDNMAIGGQGAYLLSAQLAMTKETLRTGDYVNQVLDGDRVSTSPFFNRDYNLAILAIGQNGGEDWKAHLEYTVKTIRDKGIDVIILTQNPAASNPTSRAGDEYFYRSMAETYGCLLVDTQAYFRLEVEFGRALGTTADLFGDSVHQSALGHQLYAKAILNALLDYDSTAAVPANKTVVSRSYIPAQADRAAAIAGLNSYYLVKRPDSLRGISGVTYTTATDTSIKTLFMEEGLLQTL